MSNEIKTTKELENALAGHYGSENYYRNIFGLIYTDGIKDMADKVGAYWLIDLVDSYAKDRRENPFLVWKIQVDDDMNAVVTAKADDGEPVVIRQRLDWTTFPVGDFEWYVIDGVMLLKGEY